MTDNPFIANCLHIIQQVVSPVFAALYDTATLTGMFNRNEPQCTYSSAQIGSDNMKMKDIGLI